MVFSKKVFSGMYIVIPLIFLTLAALYIFFSQKKEVVPPLPPENALYRDKTAPIDTRVNNLLSYMSFSEKVGQMALVEKNSIGAEDVARYGIGAMLSGSGAKPDQNTEEGWKNMVENFIDASTKSRLSIPLIYGVDATHGHARVPESVVFPHQIALGATRNEVLVQKIAEATARDLRRSGIRWNYAPNVDVPHDIRWGRTYETFSDDPILAGKLGAAYLRGLQGNASPINVLATPKHFVGLGGMVWGSSSNQNFTIDQGATPPDEILLRSEYLMPFKAVVDAGAQSIMVGLNSWGDTKLSGSKYLLTDVLKGELGFTGFLVSDWYGVYELSPSKYQAIVTAINAGVDMVMLPFDYKTFIHNVTKAVRVGDIPESRIDDAVQRILKAKFALGLFDTGASTWESNRTGEDRALAREAVRESLVLLKNEGVLPILTTATHIVVGGSSADNVGRQNGAWTVEWQGIEGNVFPGATSVLEGLREVASPSVRIEYDRNGKFNTNEIADIGIAVVGEAPYAEGWGDTQHPTLSESDRKVISELKKVSKKLLVVLVTGRPLIITDDLPHWDALVVAWLPGSEGGGVADVLFGTHLFTGKLPLAWPKSINQLPLKEGGVTADGTPLLFPRYSGQSY